MKREKIWLFATRVITLAVIAIFLSASIFLAHAADQAYTSSRRKNAKIVTVNSKVQTSNGEETSEILSGQLHSKDWGYLYVPNEITAQTGWGIFFPGGYYEHTLPDAVLKEYIQQYNPNAILFAFYTSGYPDMQKRVELAAETMIQAERQLAQPIQNTVIAGASNGAYVALKLTAYLHNEYGIDAEKCLLLDPGTGDINGQTYTDENMPSEQERQAIANAETMICVFEQRETDWNSIQGLNRLIDDSISVARLECADSDHDHICINSFKLGVLSWAFHELPLNRKEYFPAWTDATDGCISPFV